MLQKFTSIFTSFTLSVLILSTPATAVQTQPQDPQSLIADTGFRPSTNGFQFENYTNNDVPGLVNLTVQDMRKIFGDRVCASMHGGNCVLTPPAKKWMEDTNSSMDGGHCEGMAVLASLIYSGTASASSFGADTTPSLILTNNTPLQREVAYWFASQLFRIDNDTPNEDRTLTPSQVVAKLQSEFEKPDAQRDWFVLGLYKPAYQNGHAVTPYALDDMGNNVIRIMVYDNNFPKEERFVTVNTASDTWGYTTATNPAEPLQEYTGNAGSKTLTLSSISLRLKPPVCPFCEESAQISNQNLRELPASANTSGVVVAETTSNSKYCIPHGHCDFSQGGVSSPQGVIGGQVDGLNVDSPLSAQSSINFVNTIPGASFDLLRTGFNNTAPPKFYLPAGQPYTATMFNIHPTQTLPLGFMFSGPGFYMEMTDGILHPGESDQMMVELDDVARIYTMTYVTDNDETPILAAGLETAEADYDIDLQVYDGNTSQTVTMVLNHSIGKAIIHTQRAEGSDKYDINLAVIDDMGDHLFRKTQVPLEANSTHYLNYQGWTMGQPLKLEVDQGQDGSIDQTIYLQNDNPLKIYLPLIGR